MKKFISFILSIAICFSTTVLVKASTLNQSFNESVLNILKSCESIVLTTDELSLSMASEEELKELAKTYKEVETGYFLRNNDKILSEQEAFTELQKYNLGLNVSFAVKNSRSDLVGEIILTQVNSRLINVAYLVLPKFRGNGYAAKACKLLIRSLHTKDPDLIFLIRLDKENYSSERVAEKLSEALISKNNAESADNLKKINYEVKKIPFKLKYKISPIDGNDLNFKFDTLVNDEQVSSAVYTKEQIENITYKKIFDLKELEITRLNYVVRLVH